MPDAERIVGRRIPRAKARSAESSLDHSPRSQQIGQHSIPGQFHIDRRTGRVHTERKGTRPNALALQNVSRRTDVLKTAARTAGNDPLLHIKLAIDHLVTKGIRNLVIQADRRTLLDIRQDIIQIRLQLIDGVSIARMKRHGDHRPDLTQVDLHTPIIVSRVTRLKLLIILAAPVDLIELLDLFIRLPDGRKAGGLGRHDIDTDTEISAERSNARPHKLHHFILDIPIAKDLTDDRQRHILRSDPRTRSPCEINGHDLRHIDIISLRKKLLDQLRSTLTDRHGAKRPITSVAVRTKDHLSAARKHLTRKLMDDCLVRRHIHSTILPGAGEAKHVIILVDRPAYRTKRIVAVGQHIRDGEFFQSRSPGRLDDAHKRDIMGSQLVKLDLKLVHVPGNIVVLKDAISDGVLGRLFPRNRKTGLLLLHNRTVNQINSAVI